LARAASYDASEIDAAVRACLEPLGGMTAFVQPGQRVLLKPNLLGRFAPELAVTTHPEVVRSVLRLVREAGGVPLVGDSPGVGDLRSAARGSGILAVIEEEGAELADFDASTLFEEPENRVARRIELARAVAEADVIISLPKLKTHVQMLHTGALKNQFGLVVGTAKARYHFRFQDRDWLADLMIDINRIARPVLAVVDAVEAMEGHGPSGGTPRRLGVLAAGADLAAVDAVCCDIIGLAPGSVPLLKAAERARFGCTELDRIEVVGIAPERVRVRDFQHVQHVHNVLRLAPLPEPLLRAARRQLAPRPRIDVGRCIRCGLCKRGCPVDPSAIDPFPESGPVVNDRTCIRCYCCHEFCPVKAIDLQRTLLDRVFRFNALLEATNRGLSRVTRLFWR
jgi:uncharacterized protein (DUF362 family)/Pyruvate/2-oxoacid:ferredoxin oxidoreductase delta subunit